eukprot:20019-Eustigmatos_ZCMA.PRE.1
MVNAWRQQPTAVTSDVIQALATERNQKHNPLSLNGSWRQSSQKTHATLIVKAARSGKLDG